MAKITGADRHARRLKPMPARAILQELYTLGQMIELDAERSITEGSVSGKGHVPSAPGEPPNADTRVLDTNIETTIASSNPPGVNVTSNAPYSAALEYGSSKMEERPFMRPAVEKNKDEIGERIATIVNRNLRS